MEIPNYDSTDDLNKKYKQLFSFMPADTFRMLICGNSGSGKTNHGFVPHVNQTTTAL